MSDPDKLSTPAPPSADTKPVEEIALLTDGLQGLVLDNQQLLPHAPFFGRVFNAIRGAPPGPSAGLSDSLASFLASPYVHRRTDTKDVFPGAWDCWAGGVVTAGEPPDRAAARELTEELGVSVPALEPLFRHWYRDDRTPSWAIATAP